MHTEMLVLRLAQLSLVLFLMISALHIHWARVGHWREFSSKFDRAADEVFRQDTRPRLQYAIAAPFVAAFVAGTIGLMWNAGWAPLVWAIGSAGIALMDLAGWQTVIWRGLWADLLTKFGYLVGGALALLLFSSLG